MISSRPKNFKERKIYDTVRALSYSFYDNPSKQEGREKEGNDDGSSS